MGYIHCERAYLASRLVNDHLKLNDFFGNTGHVLKAAPVLPRVFRLVGCLDLQNSARI